MGGTARGAYPRRCGGTNMVPVGTATYQGLSPQVRGNLSIPDDLSIATGPIPAGAGEPKNFEGIPRIFGAYPRRCGGTFSVVAGGAAGGGLSPQVRGNRSQRPAWLPRFGPIPAGAGEPSVSPIPSILDRAYPRRCGGTKTTETGKRKTGGLSPQVRGNPRTT